MNDDMEVTIPEKLSQAQDRYFESAIFHTTVHTLLTTNEETRKRRLVEYAITGFLAEHAGETIEVPTEFLGLDD